MTKFEELLQKEMTRRQFLATVGLLFLSMFGFSAIFGALTKETEPSVVGYGSNFYGP